MKKVGSREFKNRQAYYLRRVKKGETLVVTERGKPVAKISPIDSDARPGVDEVLRELAAQGHIRLARKKPERFEPVPARGKPASQIIIEDRG